MKRLLLAVAITAALSPAASAGTGQTFRIHFTVLTKYETTVQGTWRMTCYSPTSSAGEEGFYRGRTPLRMRLVQALPDATRCELHVVAWNVGHPHGQRPEVQTWVVPIRTAGSP